MPRPYMKTKPLPETRPRSATLITATASLRREDLQREDCERGLLNSTALRVCDCRLAPRSIMPLPTFHNSPVFTRRVCRRFRLHLHD